MIEIKLNAHDYEVDDDGKCFVIKTRTHSRTYGGRGSSSTYRSRITSPRKIRALLKAAHEQALHDPTSILHLI